VDAIVHTDDEEQQELAQMAELARLIGENWLSPQSARQLLEEMREESADFYNCPVAPQAANCA
jgi:hypothetical protein